MTRRKTVPETPEGLQERIYELAGREVRLSSPRAVQSLLVELGLPLIERNKLGFKVDSATLAGLQESHPSEVVDLLLRWRRARAEQRRQSVAGTGERTSLRDLIDYDEIAEVMGLKVQTVRVYAVRDEDFPPVVKMLGRTPLRSRKAVQRYLRLREVRQGPTGGRPPRPTRGLE